MNWLKFYLSSSIGRKQLMAITGLLLCGFLFTHLLGNFLLFAGYDESTKASAFNDYAQSLADMGVLLYIAEAGLLGIFILHIGLGLHVTAANKLARGAKGYDFSADSGDVSLASKTMVHTGLWTLIFLVIHLINFKFANHDIPKGLYGVVENHFSQIGWVAYYIVTMFLLACHVNHGFASALQSLGLNHKKYNSFIKQLSMGFAIFIFLGYSSIPLWMFINKGGPS